MNQNNREKKNSAELDFWMFKQTAIHSGIVPYVMGFLSTALLPYSLSHEVSLYLLLASRISWALSLLMLAAPLNTPPWLWYTSAEKQS